MGRRARRCPECRGNETVPIAYGMPGLDLAEAAERGELVLGGCCITGDDPRWHCNACGADFGRPSQTPRRARERPGA